MAISEDPDQNDPDQKSDLGPRCLLLYINSSVMLGNSLQQTTFQMHFFLGALRVTNYFT